MTKKSKTKPDMVQSTLRLPRELHRQINEIAEARNLSMQQIVQEVISEYCDRAAGGNPFPPSFFRTHDFKSKKGGK